MLDETLGLSLNGTLGLALDEALGLALDETLGLSLNDTLGLAVRYDGITDGVGDGAYKLFDRNTKNKLAKRRKYALIPQCFFFSRSLTQLGPAAEMEQPGLQGHT